MKRFYVFIFACVLIILMGACTNTTVSASSADNSYNNVTPGHSQPAFDAAVAQFKSAKTHNEQIAALIQMAKVAPNYDSIDRFLVGLPFNILELREEVAKNVEWGKAYVEIPVDRFRDLQPVVASKLPDVFRNRLAERMMLYIHSGNKPDIMGDGKVVCAHFDTARATAASHDLKQQILAEKDKCEEVWAQAPISSFFRP